MICVCIGIRNRSNMLLKFAIPSLNNCERKEEIALSIFDCHSNDIPNLEEQIKKLWKGKLYYTNARNKFTRSGSTNEAVRQCEETMIFISDADVSVPTDLVALMEENVDPGKTWFPMTFMLKQGQPPVLGSIGGFSKWGCGMVGIHKKKFFRNGPLDVQFSRVKKRHEDTRFYRAVSGIIMRIPCRTLFHNWHNDNLSFKTQYYNT